jgi:hypothetical protein
MGPNLHLVLHSRLQAVLFIDEKQLNFKEDTQLIDEMKSIEKNLKDTDAKSRACGKMVGSSIGTLANGFLSLIKGKNQSNGTLPPQSGVPNQNPPPQGNFPSQNTGTPPNGTIPGQNPPPSGNFPDQNTGMPPNGTIPGQNPSDPGVQGPVDCVKNPRACVSAVEQLSQAIRSPDCKADAANLLAIVTDFSIKIAGTINPVYGLGVALTSSIVSTTLDLIKDANRGKVIRLADKLDYKAKEEKLKQLSSCFAFSLYEQVSCQQYRVYLSKDNPAIQASQAIMGENANHPGVDRIMLTQTGAIVDYSGDEDDLGKDFKEINSQIDKQYQESGASKVSREAERVAYSNQFKKILGFASSYVETKIDQGMEHLKQERLKSLEFNKELTKKKYQGAIISKIEYSPSPLIYENLIRNCYLGRTFLARGGDLAGQLKWSKKCGKLDQCIDKIHKGSIQDEKIGDEHINELFEFAKDYSESEKRSPSGIVYQKCPELFPKENSVFSYKSFNKAGLYEQIIDEESQCRGTKAIYDATKNPSHVVSLAVDLKLRNFDDQGNCENKQMGGQPIPGYNPETAESERIKELMVQCKKKIIDTAKSNDRPGIMTPSASKAKGM